MYVADTVAYDTSYWQRVVKMLSILILYLAEAVIK
jgi:hypothetical protein